MAKITTLITYKITIYCLMSIPDLTYANIISFNYATPKIKIGLLHEQRSITN